MKQLLILSGKGGTGKTTISGSFIKLANAKAFADCDVDAPNLHLIAKQQNEPEKSDYYGLPKAFIDKFFCVKCGKCEQYCKFNAISVVNRRYVVNENACEGCGVCECICPARAIEMRPAVAGEFELFKGDKIFSMAKLKMGSGTSGKLVTEVKKKMIAEAKDVKLAIVDGSPGIGCPVIASLSGVDMALIVTEPSLSGISDMERIIKTAKHFGTNAMVCVNKFDTNIENTERIEKYCQDNDLPFVGKIPYDKQAVVAINSGKSVVDVDCPSGDAIKIIYEKVIQTMKDQNLLG